nr:immunoglobulin light chain junction region [Macaca mulatta]
CSSYANINVLF